MSFPLKTRKIAFFCLFLVIFNIKASILKQLEVKPIKMLNSLLDTLCVKSHFSLCSIGIPLMMFPENLWQTTNSGMTIFDIFSVLF